MAAPDHIGGATQPDGQLIVLGAAYDRVVALRAEAEAEYERRRPAYKAAVPAKPDTLIIRPGDHMVRINDPGGGYFDEEAIRRFRDFVANEAAHRLNREAALERAREIVAAADVHEAAEAAAWESAGMEEADRAQGELDDQALALAQQIADAPAATLRGFAVKARVILAECPRIDDPRAVALLRQLERHT